MALALNTLQVGQKVAIARNGSWNIMSQGVYVVSKANKLKVVLAREGDGYERTFSVKRGLELKQYASKDKYEDRDTFVETVEEMQQRKAKQQEAARIKGLWREAAHAAECKNLGMLKDLVAQLEAVK